MLNAYTPINCKSARAVGESAHSGTTALSCAAALPLHIRGLAGHRLICGAVVAVIAVALAARAEQPTLHVPRTDTPPQLSRYVDGKTAPPGVCVTGFVQREPGDGTPISVETAAYLSYDSTNLYVVFLCKDDPAKVRAHLTKRESITGDDHVGVVLDTFRDRRRAYLFITNPLGIQMDGVATEGQEDDYSYDALWHSEGQLTSDGFAVLFSIPFRSLRFSDASKQTWGVAIGRAVVRNNETSFWPYVTRRIAGFAQQLATLEGLEGISPGRNLQAIPYGTFTSARFLEENRTRTTENQGRAGIDAKAVVKDAITLDLTANPDFSQVESDEPQVTINQRFEVYFPEKRPFFMENAGYFETPQNLFFSRRIVDPGFGVRSTGKAGRGWLFGGLVANDREPGGFGEAADPNATIAVGRLQKEFPRESYLGMIATSRSAGSTFNRVAGIDGRVKLSANWLATGQFVMSGTERPAEDRYTGSMGYAAIIREGRNFSYEGSYLDRSPGFRADLGFIPRVDMREMSHDVEYRWHRDKSRLLSFGPELETSVIWDYRGELQDLQAEAGFSFEFPGQTELHLHYERAFERFEGIEFRHQTAIAFFTTDFLKWLGFQTSGHWGTAINYYPGPGLQPFLADTQEADAGITLKPSPRLRVDTTYLFSRLTAPDDPDVPSLQSGSNIFNNHIVRLRANYQFTRRLSLRAILDYASVLPNPDLVALDLDKNLRGDVLLTYLVNPWTAIYVGYTDAYANIDDTAAGGPAVPRPGGPTTPIGRQLFIKASYLLRW